MRARGKRGNHPTKTPTVVPLAWEGVGPPRSARGRAAAFDVTAPSHPLNFKPRAQEHPGRGISRGPAAFARSGPSPSAPASLTFPESSFPDRFLWAHPAFRRRAGGRGMGGRGPAAVVADARAPVAGRPPPPPPPPRGMEVRILRRLLKSLPLGCPPLRQTCSPL